METQFINLNMTPSGINPTFHIAQYDVGRLLGFHVYNGSEVVDLDGYTCTIEATRTDGTQITANVITTNNQGVFAVTAEMSNEADKYACQLVVIDSNANRIASLPFIMDVITAALNGNAESINEDRTLYQQYNAAMQAALANEANNRINADNLEKVTRQSDVNTLQNNIDAEVTARQTADITLQNNIDAEATARQTADNTLQFNIDAEASTRASADSNLQSQINQIVAPSGEAPSAAEVQNARIGADGVTYDTLGTAIRTQVNNLNNHIKNIKKVNIFDKTDITRGGYFRGTIGADINSVIEADGAFYANQIWDVKEGDIIRTSHPYMGLTIYDTTGKLIAKFDDENLSHVVPSGGVKLRYSSTVTSVNYVDNAMITINSEMPETYIPYSLDSFPTYEDSLIAKNFNDIENKYNDLENKYNELENKKTFVILRFDGTGNEDFIEDRRYAMVHEEYGYNCTISIGYTSSGLATTSEQFQKLMKYGVDFGIYSNNNPPSLDILSSNSQEAISICDTYVKNATEAAKAIGAYCPVTWLCRQSNSGYALELALKKYGYMLASGIYYGDANTGLIENSNKFTLQTTSLYPSNISTAISRLDTAVEKGYDIAILTHKFYDTAEEAQENYGCTEDIYRQFLSAVKSYVDAGKVEVLTYSEYISKRKDNAVLRSKESQRIANWIFN